MTSDRLKQIGMCILIPILFYLVIAWMIFQARNPMANSMQFYRHFGDMITFQRLPQFQERSAPEEKP